jgi:hypothetical protein
MQGLSAPEIEDALTALPAWHRYGDFLARHIPVQRGAHEGLLEGVRKVVDDADRFHVMDAEDGVLIYLGDPQTHTVIPDDVETAARIDTVVDGTGDMV